MLIYWATGNVKQYPVLISKWGSPVEIKTCIVTCWLKYQVLTVVCDSRQRIPKVWIEFSVNQIPFI